MTKENKALLKRHLYSFAKTYVTVFLGIYLTLVAGGKKIGVDFDLFDPIVLELALEGAFISTLRNVYKLLDPNESNK